MGSGQGAPRDAIAIDVVVTAKITACFQLVSTHHLATVVIAPLMPLQWRAQTMIHADIQVSHHEYRGLQVISEVQRCRRMIEKCGRILRQQKHMEGNAMTDIATRKPDGLMGAGGARMEG